MHNYYTDEITDFPANRNNVPKRILLRRSALIAGIAIVLLALGWWISR
jgi:hypothetical protein